MTTLLQELNEVLGVIADEKKWAPLLLAERFLDDHAPEIRAALELQAKVEASIAAIPRYTHHMIGTHTHWRVEAIQSPHGTWCKHSDVWMHYMSYPPAGGQDGQ